MVTRFWKHDYLDQLINLNNAAIIYEFDNNFADDCYTISKECAARVIHALEKINVQELGSVNHDILERERGKADSILNGTYFTLHSISTTSALHNLRSHLYDEGTLMFLKTIKYYVDERINQITII